jgi:hypothetical protein
VIHHRQNPLESTRRLQLADTPTSTTNFTRDQPSDGKLWCQSCDCIVQRALLALTEFHFHVECWGRGVQIGYSMLFIPKLILYTLESWSRPDLQRQLLTSPRGGRGRGGTLWFLFTCDSEYTLNPLIVFWCVYVTGNCLWPVHIHILSYRDEPTSLRNCVVCSNSRWAEQVHGIVPSTIVRTWHLWSAFRQNIRHSFQSKMSTTFRCTSHSNSEWVDIWLKRWQRLISVTAVNWNNSNLYWNIDIKYNLFNIGTVKHLMFVCSCHFSEISALSRISTPVRLWCCVSAYIYVRTFQPVYQICW